MLLLLDNDIYQNPGPLQNEISIFYINARSVRNKISYIENIASEFTILCITESHLDNNISNNDIAIEGFSEIYRKDRNWFVGGVLVYISQNISVKRKAELKFENNELVWFEILIPNLKLRTCVVYRPPGTHSSYWDNFDYSIEQALNISQNIVVTGDLNVDLLRETNNRLNDIINFYDLTNVISEPTRMGSLLDPILVSNPNITLDAEVVQIDRNISDHDATLVHIKISNIIKEPYTRKVWLYKNADFISLNQEINNFDWEHLLGECANVDTTKYLELIGNYIPSKTVLVILNDKPWFNSEIRREIRKRNRLHEIKRMKKDENSKQKYKAQRNKVNNMIKYAREQFLLSANEIVDSFLKNNSKSYWSLVKKFTKGTEPNFTIPPLHNAETNELVYDDKEKLIF